MSKPVIIVASLALLILFYGILLFSVPPASRPRWRAESLLLVHPLPDTLWRSALKRQLRRSNPGIERVEFQFSPYTHTTFTTTTQDTNGIIRLVAAGATPTDAEQIANKAATELSATLKQLKGVRVTVLDQARSLPRFPVQKPSRLTFGGAIRRAVRSEIPEPFPVEGRVLFPQAGLSLDPGEHWMRYYAITTEPACALSLLGEGSFDGASIHARALGPASRTGGSAIEYLRRQIAHQPGLIESSATQEPFQTDSGLHGTHASFARQYPGPNPGQGGVMRVTQTTHYYLLTNAHSVRVMVEYDTISGPESQQVQEMIRSSLRAD